MNKKLCLLLLLIFPLWAQGEKKGSIEDAMEEFSNVIVSDNGRVKPMESLSQNYLIAFSGRSSYEKMSAVEWMMRLIFDGKSTFDDKVFRIDNNDLLTGLKLEPSKTHRYSFRELEPHGKDIETFYTEVSSKPKELRGAFDNAVLNLYSNMIDYFSFASALSFSNAYKTIAVEDKNLKAKLGLDVNQNEFSYLELRAHKEALLAMKNSKVDTESLLLTSYEIMSNEYSTYPIFVLPLRMPILNRLIWASPWQSFQVNNYKNSSFEEEIALWSDMVGDYRNGDFFALNEKLHEFNLRVRRILAKGDEKDLAGQIATERVYNHVDAFFWSKLFFFIGLAFMAAFYLRDRANIWKTLGIVMNFGGILMGLVGLILRILITGRPPVTNLYETFIFVGIGTAIISMVIELYKKNGLGVFTASICGALILLVASGFTKGDTMPVLVAVLRSNFWLSTHVTTITIGYMGMIVTGVIAHFYIIMAMKKEQPLEKMRSVLVTVKGSLAFSFLFAILGTILGGIWADQSWGRFWGWDPKENGALLIVLWGLILFHAKASGFIKDVGFAMGSAFGIVVTLMSWLGVNLLSVGLHSYGFTESAADILFVVVGVEMVFLYVSFIVIARRHKQVKS